MPADAAYNDEFLQILHRVILEVNPVLGGQPREKERKSPPNTNPKRLFFNVN